MKKTAILFLLISSLMALNTVMASDWPRWRGPEANGVSQETGWNAKALSGNPRILWKANVEKGHSEITIKDGRLFTLGNKMLVSGNDTTYMDMIYCLDANTGRELWRYSYPGRDRAYPGPRTTSLIDDKSVYTLGAEGDLFCFDAQSGMVKWTKNLVQTGLAQTPDWGFAGSPVVEGDLLIVNAGSKGMAFNKNSGAIVWKSEQGASTLPSPVLFETAGKRMVAIPANDKLHVLNTETGEEAWTYPWPRGLDIDPIFQDGKLYIASYGGTMAYDINGAEHTELFNNRRARFSSFQNYTLTNGHIFGFGRAGRRTPLQCVDIATGDVKWTEDLGEWGSLMAADGKLIILTGNGRLVIAEASGEAFTKISDAKVLRMSDNSGLEMPRQCWCWTQPVLANGKIYARNNYGELVCVNMK